MPSCSFSYSPLTPGLRGRGVEQRARRLVRGVCGRDELRGAARPRAVHAVLAVRPQDGAGEGRMHRRRGPRLRVRARVRGRTHVVVVTCNQCLSLALCRVGPSLIVPCRSLIVRDCLFVAGTRGGRRSGRGRRASASRSTSARRSRASMVACPSAGFCYLCTT